MRNSRCQPPSQVPTRRSGLSLIEMILSVGLGLLLLGGMYSAIDQSNRRQSIGQVEAERLQIARAILKRIELDLRATMFDASTAMSDSSSDSDTSSSSSSSGTGGTSGGGTDTGSTDSTSTEIGGSTEEEWTGSLGIRGSANELWIDLSQIRRELEFTTDGMLASSDLKTVAYFLSNSDTAIDSDDTALSLIDDTDGTGLARSEGDRSVLRELNSSNGDSVLPGPTQVLAPEINQLQFRFFDGLTWYEEWDSSTTGALPRAVEITIGFEAAPERGGYLGNSAVSASTQTIRLVVAIPVSDPLAMEESY